MTRLVHSGYKAKPEAVSVYKLDVIPYRADMSSEKSPTRMTKREFKRTLKMRGNFRVTELCVNQAKFGQAIMRCKLRPSKNSLTDFNHIAVIFRVRNTRKRKWLYRDVSWLF
jgi:hypothetical protein